MSDVSTLLWPALQIIWINILLSGDNAVVIALAARGLDPRRRRWAIFWGSFAAIALRIVFTVFVVTLQTLPYVKIASGLLLLWIAIGLLGEDDEHNVDEAGSIFAAVRSIALADVIMSLDNVVAVAAAAKNSVPLIAFGIVASVPLIVFGSALLLKALRRFPVIVVAGAALLGWVAGEISVTDPKLSAWVGPLGGHATLIAQLTGAGGVLAFAAMLPLVRRLRRALEKRSGKLVEGR